MVINTYEKLCVSISFFLLFVLRIIFYRMAKNQESKIDLEIISPKDYTLKVKGLPKNVTPEQIFLKFGYLINGKQLKIAKLNLTYDIGKFVQLV